MMKSRILRPTSFEGLFVILGLFLMSTTNALRGNSWQKRIDRAFLQVDGVSPQGRFRSFQRALKDPELRTDVSKAINVVREKGFGKGHPEFIELLWPEGTQARRDLEAINALTKQLSERSDEVQNKKSSSQGLVDIIQSSQKNLRFGEEGSRAVLSSFLESDSKRVQTLAGNVLRNTPMGVESPSYKLLATYSEGAAEKADSESAEEGKNTQKKSFLTIPELELRQYDAFRSVSVPLIASGSSSSQDEIYTLKNMGSALTEIFSYLELGNNAESTLMSMTTPFFISDAITDGTNKMFAMIPQDQQNNPPKAVGSSRVVFDDIPETVMATLQFPGICTDKEIKRQKAKLVERIETAGDIGWKIRDQQISDTKNDDTKGDNTEEELKKEINPELFVLQYNAPGTLPWRRMNEIAVVMEKTGIEISSEIEAEVETEVKTEVKTEVEAEVEDEVEDENENEEKQNVTEMKSDEKEESEDAANDSNDESPSTTDSDVEK